MENLNLTPIPVQPKRKYSRTIALSVVGLALAVGFLAYTGGFSMLAKIFGSHAGTETSIVFAGSNNLQGNKDADQWVLGDTFPASFNGAGAFTSFTGVPAHSVLGTSDESFVAPLVTSLNKAEDMFTNHIYISPGLDLGTNSANLSQITAYLYLPEGALVTTSYRTAAEPTELATASWVALTGTPTMLPQNESVKVITATLTGALSRYLQFQADFQDFEPTNRPAVYGWVAEPGQTEGGMGITGVPEPRTITLTYEQTNAPALAHIAVLSSDPTAAPVYTQNGVNLSTATEHSFNLQLSPGAYALVITSPTTQTKTVPFEAGVSPSIQVALGSFLTGFGEGVTSSADLNHDGAVNSLDAVILFNQIAQPTP